MKSRPRRVLGPVSGKHPSHSEGELPGIFSLEANVTNQMLTEKYGGVYRESKYTKCIGYWVELGRVAKDLSKGMIRDGVQETDSGASHSEKDRVARGTERVQGEAKALMAFSEVLINVAQRIVLVRHEFQGSVYRDGLQ